jgi:hypothetical protein
MALADCFTLTFATWLLVLRFGNPGLAMLHMMAEESNDNNFDQFSFRLIAKQVIL